MITKSIIQIIFGWLLWRFVPGLITQGSRKSRTRIQLCCNIAGIILVVLGVLHLVQTLLDGLL